MLFKKRFYFTVTENPSKTFSLFCLNTKMVYVNFISFMLHFLGIQKLLSSSSYTQSKKILTIKKPDENNHENKQRTLVVKYGKKYRYMPVSNRCLCQKKSLSEKCEYVNERFWKGHCLMIVHSGINKMWCVERFGTICTI